MAKQTINTADLMHQTALLVAVDAPYNKTKNIEGYFEEFLNLVKTNGSRYVSLHHIKLRTIDPSYFITKGKLEELKKICDDLPIDFVIFSDPLSPKQERNLEDYLGVDVIDRTNLILQIFEKAALSNEGKAQVAIAMLQHQKTRLAGKGVYLSQQAGVIGLRGGPGETLKERERRFIEDEVLKLKRQLESIQKSRDVQRKRRLSNKVPHICLIGYTNAGKSTILNTLTKSDVLAEDKLFATLDTTTRELYINSVKKGVISDTVGFIQQLPPKLIEAFKSTLDELQYANLLLQIIDATDINWEDHIKVVNDILKELKVEKDMLYVFNKCDLVEDLEAFERTIFRYEPNVLVSGTSKEGLAELIEYLDQWSPTGAEKVDEE
jgi:GTP-binding protein HflX